nr:immunoglobulin light chain junction region [Macaca mulatta]
EYYCWLYYSGVHALF